MQIFKSIIVRMRVKYWRMHLEREENECWIECFEGECHNPLKHKYPDEYKEWLRRRMNAVAQGKKLVKAYKYNQFRFWLFLRRIHD